MRFPFEATPDELLTDPEPFVSSVFSCLESEFIVMPRGPGFIDYAVFEQGYEALKKATDGFTRFSSGRLTTVVSAVPISFVVLRSMLGFTPPEWAYVASQRTGVAVDQGFARSHDRRVRMNPLQPLKPAPAARARLNALVKVAAALIRAGAPPVGKASLHRLDKVDTRNGLAGMRSLAALGVPYPVLLYERFLGRPFAGHRDSVSELVGGGLESAIEDVLTEAGISYRKTKRAESITGFDQTPDFIIPSEFNPQIIIEAKLTEDDGTARDKVTRIQHLAELSAKGQPTGQVKYEVVACIGGRGFAVRREDMKKMLIATRGKVFTLKTMDRLVEFTRLKEYRTK
jgi:hypothetical protein